MAKDPRRWITQIEIPKSRKQEADLEGGHDAERTQEGIDSDLVISLFS